MKISVVTVCYNSVDTIEKTMLSVLNQTYPDVEYIIIDGGSTDGTVDIIKKYSDKLAYWISEPDKGIYDAMNKGISVATGDYINFMNSGDRFYNNKVISKLLEKIDTSAIIVYGNWNHNVGASSWIRKPKKESEIKTDMILCHQACFINLSYHKINNFDLNFKIAADYNFMYRTLYVEKQKSQYIPLTISDFNGGEGYSVVNPMASLKERFRIWGIENHIFKKIPFLMEGWFLTVKLKIKKTIPQNILKNFYQLRHS